MYKVIKMYGDFEPWWFLDGWEEDVVSRVTYERYEDALSAFQKEWVKLLESFPKKKSKNGERNVDQRRRKLQNDKFDEQKKKNKKKKQTK